MRVLGFVLFASSIAAFGACTPYDPSLGAAPFLCGASDPKCPDGYTCTGMDSQNRPTCVNGTGGGPTVDGQTSGFQCADDSDIEGPSRNDDVGHAWQTPINQSGKLTFPLAGLAICPAGDKDTYAVNITQEGQNLTALVEYQADGTALTVSILNSGGTPIASGSPAGTDMVMATVNNLPTGSSPYYVQVAGSTATGENNYKVTFTVTGP
jgi:hypothetical protein